MKTTNEQNLKNKNHGITLIALIITIIVMLILVAVTVTMAVNGGLFEKAASAGRQTNEARDKEIELAEGETIQDLINKYATSTGVDSGNKGDADKPKSPYVGCYADIDGVDGIDGIIYADLAVGGSGGNPRGGWEPYTIPVKTNLKEYEMSENVVEGPFGERKVVTLAEEDETKNERFYVMALTDFTTDEYEYFYWDKNVNNVDYGTSMIFGAGADNTEKLINYWENNSKDNTTWADQDIWKYLTGTDGWFVPSGAEWSAFAVEVDDIDLGNYSDYGLNEKYWSSSLYDSDTAAIANFYEAYVCTSDRPVDCDYNDIAIRLSTIF